MTADAPAEVGHRPRYRLLEDVPPPVSSLRFHLSLTRELAVTSFKLKYAGSVLGYIWTLVKPLLLFGMLYLVFALLLLRGRTSDAEHFPVQLLLGIVVWTFFADATSSSLAAVVGNADVVRKAYFPRWILVAAATTSAAMTLLVNSLLVIVVGLMFHWYALGWDSLLVVPLLLELLVLALGVGLGLGALYVSFRDLGHVWEILLQLVFYGSAIVFPIALLPTGLTTLALMNPVAQIVEDIRRAAVTPLVPWTSDVLGIALLIPVMISLVALIAGATIFRLLSRRFGERL